MTPTDPTAAGAVVTDTGPDGLVRVVVSGAVNAVVAGDFAAACERALGANAGRLELDLSGVDDVGAAGVAVIARSLSMGRRLSGGVRVCVATAAGRRALLAATDRF